MPDQDSFLILKIGVRHNINARRHKFKMKKIFGILMLKDAWGLWNFISRSSALFYGLSNTAVVTIYFSLEDQGYYYVILSILLSQVIFEMGINYVATNYISHEFTNLRWMKGYILKGNYLSFQRARSIIKKNAMIISLGSIFFLLFSVVYGLFIFQSSSDRLDASFLFLFFAICSVSAIKFLVVGFEAVLEGLGEIVYVSRVRIFSGGLGLLAFVFCAVTNFGLTSIFYQILVFVTASIASYLYKYKLFLFQLIHGKFVTQFNWWLEVWPLQWKISLSWISGFATFNLFNPLVFYFCGPSAAAKFGLALSLTAAVSSLAAAFVNAQVPRVCDLVASAQHDRLKRLWRGMEATSVSVAIVAAAGCLGTIEFARHTFTEISPKLPELALLLVLMCGTVVQQFSNTVAVVVRAHKSEPFLIPSLFAGFLTMSLLLVVVPEYCAIGAAMVSLFVTLGVAVPSAVWIGAANLQHLSRFQSLRKRQPKA